MSRQSLTCLLIAMVSVCASLRLVAQTGAYALFEQGKRLEALPLFEELVKANPQDSASLVALAACLVDHAATLPDQTAGGRERLRARDLLDRAWELGNRSTLAMNLSQLLKQLPESGAVRYSDNPRVDEAMRAGEAAFSRRAFDEAIEHYGRALALEPGNYSAALFIGNTYDRQKDVAHAATWYERAIALDPNVETAYRYYADMMAKQGDMDKARTLLIQAAVAEPYNRVVWRELHAWAALNHTAIAAVLIGVPPEWREYWDVRARWRTGGAFNTHFPEEREYRHSLPEEAEALASAAEHIERLRSDDSARLLLSLYQAHMIEPYVLFSLGDAGIAHDYDAFRASHRGSLEAYLDKYVVPRLHEQ
jgi:tetratricopeptide (TPR) repeat protein